MISPAILRKMRFMVIDYKDTIEAIRSASSETLSSTEWEQRLTEIIGRHDGELFRGLLRYQGGSDNYLEGAKDFLVALTGIPIAWMKMSGLRFEAYVYTAEGGVTLSHTLMLLGANSCAVHSYFVPSDGITTHRVKGSL
jgi:hypothetical protein